MMINYKYKFAKKLESEEEYRKVADDLLRFAQKESSLDMDEFPVSLMISPKSFAAFSEHSEYFAIAYDTAMCLMGDRLKRLANEGAEDQGFALEMQSFHDYKHRKWRNSLKLSDEDIAARKKAYIDRS